MNTLDDLLKLGERELQHRQAQRLAKAAAEQAEADELRMTNIEKAMTAAKNLLGEGVLVGLLIGSQCKYSQRQRGCLIEIPLKFDLQLAMLIHDTDIADAKLVNQVINNDCLPLPRSYDDIGAFIVARKNQWEGKQLSELREREGKVEKAIEYILSGGRSHYDFYESPKQVLEAWKFLETKDLNLWHRLEDAYANYCTLEAERQAAEAAAEAHQADVQSKVFYDFIVWKIHYAARADDHEEGLYTDTDYSLTPEPDDAGYYDIIRRGEVFKTKYPRYALTKIEKVEVTNWDTQVASLVCAKETIDGAVVKVMSANAVVLD